MTDFDLDAALARILEFDAQPVPPEPEWYGVGRLLKDWLGVPQPVPLLLMVYHGIKWLDTPVPMYQTAPVPVFTQTAAQAEILRTRYNRVAFNAGYPMVHWRRLKGITRAPDAVGTLAFPAHSTHHIGILHDWTALADELAGLPDRFQPVTVCLYWKDLMDGSDRPFRDRGLPVVTAGHMFDPEFGPRLYGFLREVRWTCGNGIGSHIVKSVEMGIPSFLVGTEPRYVNRTGEINQPTRVPGETFGEATERSAPTVPTFRAMLPRAETVTERIDPAVAQWVQRFHGCDAAAPASMLRAVILLQVLKNSSVALGLYRMLQQDRALLDAIGPAGG